MAKIKTKVLCRLISDFDFYSIWGDSATEKKLYEVFNIVN